MDTKKILEKDIQREICEWLTTNHYFFWRNNNIPVFGRGNHGRMAYRAQSKYTPKGLPDILIIKEGELIGIEVKREQKLELSEHQENIKAKFIENGAYYFKVASVEDLKKCLGY